MSGPLVIVGDILLDRDVQGVVERICPDAPAPVLDERGETVRPGGAGLAALLAAADRSTAAGLSEVVLLTALADDDAASSLRSLLAPSVRLLTMPDRSATREKVRLRSGATTLLRLDRGGPSRPDGGGLDPAAEQVLRSASAVLVSDYGGGVTSDPRVRSLLAQLPARVPLVWDPHPRGAPPVARCTLVTPNLAEAQGFSGRLEGRGLVGTEVAARSLVRTWGVTAVAVTLGADGALLSYGDGAPLHAPAPAVTAVDTCGAGDRFATAAAQLLAEGAVLSEAVSGAVVRAARFIAAGGASGIAAAGASGVAGGAAGLGSRPTPTAGAGADPAQDVIARVRAAGGTVVATGGCFDILHAGHVATLRAARELGDCLVVALNSDESVRGRKGPTRPIVPEHDRAQVLEALECVDAVVLFDEDTPEAILAQLHPDIWAKGGDYSEDTLPEAALVRSWGGRAVVLPYLDGRSTSRLVDRITTSSVTA